MMAAAPQASAAQVMVPCTSVGDASGCVWQVEVMRKPARLCQQWGVPRGWQELPTGELGCEVWPQFHALCCPGLFPFCLFCLVCS